MEHEVVQLGGISVLVVSVNTLIVGSGAAGFNAADRLYDFGRTDIALVTEGLNMGTSRNTGSDKQTYYKLTLAGEGSDSVLDMAKTLFEGGAMDGDLALCEAASSIRSFYRLAEIGVPFPHNGFGEYVGYKTDHDPRQRATSAGPLTSKFMTERLQVQIEKKAIPIFDGYRVIRVLTYEGECRGVLCLNTNGLAEKDTRYVLFNTTNVVYATGGPAGLYSRSVYPESQSGATGLALEAGAEAKNLTEWQYGIASVKFRWNLSGTYQQVLPRYISTDLNGGDEREFLDPYFTDSGKMLDAIFLKGYQWPFDPRKLLNWGSSLIDVFVYNETQIKGRRVFMDFTRNPSRLKTDFSNLGSESYSYLEKSGALFGTPIERLAHMNGPAIKLYKTHGIDLTSEPLEIAVCAQHNNGGLSGNHWWESNIRGFFPVGEVNGSHGVYRPGGSALNAGQCGSLRAAQYIAAQRGETPLSVEDFILKVGELAAKRIEEGEGLLKGLKAAAGKGDAGKEEGEDVLSMRRKISERMSAYGAHIRTQSDLESLYGEALADWKGYFEKTRLSHIRDLPIAFSNYDLLVAQCAYAYAMLDYIDQGGRSRGSYLISDPEGELPHDQLSEAFRFSLEGQERGGFIQETLLYEGLPICSWRKVRDIPQPDNWFENVWNAYQNGAIYK